MKFLRLFFFLLSFSLSATPTSVFWTNCTTNVLEPGTGDFAMMNFFAPYKTRNHPVFPFDIGLEFGLFDWNGFKCEAGFDYLAGINHPWFFNAKIGIEEDLLFCHAPSFSLGFFGAGTRFDFPMRTNGNVIDFVIGKDLPECIGGHLFLGAYAAQESIGRDRSGFMVAYTNYFCAAENCDGEDYYRWYFAADYASGKNAIGGGGFGIGHYFTPNISMLIGPVWFNDTSLLGKWKLLIEIDVLFQAFKYCSGKHDHRKVDKNKDLEPEENNDGVREGNEKKEQNTLSDS